MEKAWLLAHGLCVSEEKRGDLRSSVKHAATSSNGSFCAEAAPVPTGLAPWGWHCWPVMFWDCYTTSGGGICNRTSVSSVRGTSFAAPALVVAEELALGRCGGLREWGPRPTGTPGGAELPLAVCRC